MQTLVLWVSPVLCVVFWGAEEGRRKTLGAFKGNKVRRKSCLWYESHRSKGKPPMDTICSFTTVNTHKQPEL